MNQTHSFPLTVYYEDTDMAAIVYYANYLRFIERARSEIVEEMGIDQNAMREAGLVFAVKTEHYAQSRVRWVFDQHVMRGDELIFKARVTAVCMTTEGRPTGLPAEIRALMTPKRAE